MFVSSNDRSSSSAGEIDGPDVKRSGGLFSSLGIPFFPSSLLPPIFISVLMHSQFTSSFVPALALSNPFPPRQTRAKPI